MECRTCRSNSGEKRISPGPTIFEGEHWLVEHAYPIKRMGWLVIVLKRHAEALHELTPQKFAELGQVQAKLTKFLFEELHCEKEYISRRQLKKLFRQARSLCFASCLRVDLYKSLNSDPS